MLSTRDKVVKLRYDGIGVNFDMPFFNTTIRNHFRPCMHPFFPLHVSCHIAVAITYVGHLLLTCCAGFSRRAIRFGISYKRRSTAPLTMASCTMPDLWSCPGL